jgi:hypothetical protein
VIVAWSNLGSSASSSELRPISGSFQNTTKRLSETRIWRAAWIVSGIELSASLTRLNLHQPSLPTTYMLKVTKPVAGSSVLPMTFV